MYCAKNGGVKEPDVRTWILISTCFKVNKGEGNLMYVRLLKYMR